MECVAAATGAEYATAIQGRIPRRKLSSHSRYSVRLVPGSNPRPFTLLLSIDERKKPRPKRDCISPSLALVDDPLLRQNTEDDATLLSPGQEDEDGKTTKLDEDEGCRVGLKRVWHRRFREVDYDMSESSNTSGLWECWCGKRAKIVTSWTVDNLGRRFQTCAIGKVCRWAAHIDHGWTLLCVNGLKELSRRVNALEARNDNLKEQNTNLQERVEHLQALNNTLVA
ncbi:GRF zinc finger containing protein, partial [Striga asiatica]